jgi:hypothetical protein
MGTYHFISHDKEIELFSNRRDAFEFRLGKNLANRVMWGIHNDHLGSGGYGASSCSNVKKSTEHPGFAFTYRSSSTSMVQSLLVGFLTESLGG